MAFDRFSEGTVIHAYACPNCGKQDWKLDGTNDPESCVYCRKADFTYRCPVCNLVKVEKMSEYAWSIFNSDMYNPPLWSCERCGVYFNPRITGSVGEFEVVRINN